ncbi:NUDIX hydrolase [Rossellomorea arthrocnemi]|uniref:NUDIX hydrolase n=1 Tax=Rossellomorea arthrocnemi TaxID=2769542 RepID=UPI001918C055|nr:NUDIX hydrolase [Rossellomorea arthrocnemi]
MNLTKKNGIEFLDFIRMPEENMFHYQPLAGSFAVMKCEGKFLMCYNVWRKQWKLPAGRREGDETPKECAIREAFEETGQIVLERRKKELYYEVSSINKYFSF